MTSYFIDGREVPEPFSSFLEPDTSLGLSSRPPVVEAFSEPLSIVQEPVSYFARSSRVRDCGDDSALLIDDDGVVSAVPAETFDDAAVDDDDDFDDFPSFCNNLSVVRPFGSDVLSAITEEDKEDMSSNLSAVPESLDRSFSRSERDDEAELSFDSRNVESAATTPTPGTEVNLPEFDQPNLFTGNGTDESVPNFQLPSSNIFVEPEEDSLDPSFGIDDSQTGRNFLTGFEAEPGEEDVIELGPDLTPFEDVSHISGFSDAIIPNLAETEICVDDISRFYESDAVRLSVLPIDVKPPAEAPNLENSFLNQFESNFWRHDDQVSSLIKLFFSTTDHEQGTLTEGEGSIRLISSLE